jgi:hypothetical protein
MDSVSGADASHWNPENKEYESLREHSHNVLLEGPIALTDGALRLIRSRSDRGDSEEGQNPR